MKLSHVCRTELVNATFHRPEVEDAVIEVLEFEDRVQVIKYWVDKWHNDEKHEDSAEWYMSKVREAIENR